MQRNGVSQHTSVGYDLRLIQSIVNDILADQLYCTFLEIVNDDFLYVRELVAI